MKFWVSHALTIIILISGGFALWWGTNGGTAWTAEAARRQTVRDSPIPLPNAELQDHQGRELFLHQLSHDLLVMDFIFTRCASLCRFMGHEFRQVEHYLSNQDQGRQRVRLLNLSFDPNTDGLEELSNYLAQYAAGPTWSAATIQDPETLRQLLATLGVIVIPDPQFGYVHNAAFYLIRNHKVIGIYDYEDRSSLLTQLDRLLKEEPS